MIMNLKNYDNEIKKLTTDISTANGRITKNASDIVASNSRISKTETDIATANGLITKNATDISTANGRITKNATDITTANSNISTLRTDISTANGKITKNTTDITTANGKITQNASAISTTNSNLATLRTEFNAVSDLAYNRLCYTAVITIAQSASYVFESPFLRGMFIGQINNFVHIIHVCRDGTYAAAEGFKTENMNLMSITANATSVTIKNENPDNVLRVFILFK